MHSLLAFQVSCRLAEPYHQRWQCPLENGRLGLFYRCSPGGGDRVFVCTEVNWDGKDQKKSFTWQNDLTRNWGFSTSIEFSMPGAWIVMRVWGFSSDMRVFFVRLKFKYVVIPLSIIMHHIPGKQHWTRSTLDDLQYCVGGVDPWQLRFFLRIAHRRTGL